VNTIRLTHQLPDAEVAALKGTFLGEGSYDLLVPQEPTAVYRPDGELLLKYLPNELPGDLCAQAYDALQNMGNSAELTNRGTATGVRSRRSIRADGSRSNTTRVDYREAQHLSKSACAVVGSIERSGGRFPVCRLTAYTLDEPDHFAAAVPWFQTIDQVFKRECPDRYQAQLGMVQQTHPAWVIHGTAFTTVTINRDWRTAVHQDAGDLREGFGVMTALRAGTFEGCYLVFPAFRVAVDMRTRCVLLADVHQWHGNTALKGLPGEFRRVSCVLYYRRRMHACLSPEKETEVAKRRRPGDAIWPPGTFDDAEPEES
jgi:hypothetical protein